jgi:hypothetical protein
MAWPLGKRISPVLQPPAVARGDAHAVGHRKRRIDRVAALGGVHLHLGHQRLHVSALGENVGQLGQAHVAGHQGAGHITRC